MAQQGVKSTAKLKLMLNKSPIDPIAITTYLFINNGTLDFSNEINTIDHIGLIFSGIHIHPMPHVSCKFGNNVLKNKVIHTIFVKDTKSGRI